MNNLSIFILLLVTPLSISVAAEPPESAKPFVSGARLDHVGVAVRDLDRTRADYETLGFQVLPGGHFPGGASNAIIDYEDAVTGVPRCLWTEPEPKLLTQHSNGSHAARPVCLARAIPFPQRCTSPARQHRVVHQGVGDGQRRLKRLGTDRSARGKQFETHVD